jgi:hypothetical protein
VVFWALEYLRADFPLATVTSAVMITILTVVIFQLTRFVARRYFGPLKGALNAATGLVAFILSLVIAQVTAEPITTLVSYAYYDITGELPAGAVDMSAWRLVFFGLVLMLTLRFYQNGLLYPIVQYFFRPGVLKETVAKRDAAGDLAEAEASL